MANPSLSDWIGVAANVFTTIATTVTAVIAALVYRQQNKTQKPIFSVRIKWAEDGKEKSLLVVTTTIFNRFDTPFRLEKIEAFRPHGSWLRQDQGTILYSRPQTGSSELSVDFEIKRKGSILNPSDNPRAMPFIGRSELDRMHIKFYLFCPHSWDGGKVRLIFYIYAPERGDKPQKITTVTHVPRYSCAESPPDA